MPMQIALNRIIYIDDSAEPRSNLAVFGWIEISPENWNETLEKWLAVRRQMFRKFGVPPTKELHATNFVHGRGRVAKSPPSPYIVDGQTQWKELGRDLAEHCLSELQSIQGLKVGSVYRNYGSLNERQAKESLYRDFVYQYSEQLVATNSLAIFFVDGDGSDPMFRKAHRSLDLKDRRIIEDSIQLSSTHSQFIQIADLVAYCALAQIDRASNNEFAWGWYSKYLAHRDPNREPLQL